MAIPARVDTPARKPRRDVWFVVFSLIESLPPVYRTPFHTAGGRLDGMVLTRRMFVAGAAGAAAFSLSGLSYGMSIHLSCGVLGIKASQAEAIDYAARYGFDVVDADGRYLCDLAQPDLTRLLDSMRAKNVGWAMAGFPTEFRKDDAAFNE